MCEETSSSIETFEQQQSTGVPRLGLGRGKPRPTTNDDEPSLTSAMHTGRQGASNNSPSIFTNNNNENSKLNSASFSSRSGDSGFGSRSGGGGFGLRSGDGGFGSRSSSNFTRSERGGFSGSNAELKSGNSTASRICYNCHKTGHISRDCPGGQRNHSGGNSANQGGFGYRTNDRTTKFESSTNSSASSFRVTIRNSQNENDNNYGDSKSFFSGYRGDEANGSAYDNNSSESSKTMIFNNSTRGGFRGGRSGDGRLFSRDHNNCSGSNNCYNCGSPNHRARDCLEQKKPRNTTNSDFYSAGSQRKKEMSDGDFNQTRNHQASERYVPSPPPTNEAGIFGEAVVKGENFNKYYDTQVHCTPEDKVKPIDLYDEADLGKQLLSNIRRARFEEPMAIQRYAIPVIKAQDDLMACAQTGSGKTAAFLLPIISNLLKYYSDELSIDYSLPSPLCLIVSPTRELAVQTEHEARKFAFNTDVKCCSVIGGSDMFTVSNRLQDGCHILSATTGRLLDMVQRGLISLRRVRYFVLDEADRMLDTGFEPDIRKLEDLGLPPKDGRFTFMFSATFPNEVQQLAKHFLREDYIFLAVGTVGGANEDITQTVEEVPNSKKKARLIELLENYLESERCLIFVETKRSADYIGSLLSQKKLTSTTMHGDRTQRQRHEAVQQFANGKCPILVATSVAARGLDFPLIGYVINYDLPDTSDLYIHRIGRTGRAGHLGKSISFFDPDRDVDRRIAPDLISKLSEAGQEVPEFLKRYADNANDKRIQDYSRGQNIDMRSGLSSFGSRSGTNGPTGRTTLAGSTSESWD